MFTHFLGIKESEMKKKIPLLFAYSTILIGASSMLLFTFFLFFGSIMMVDLGLGDGKSLLFDACLCLMFFGQHSLMVRPTFKKRVAQLIPEKYGSAVYTMASGLTLLILMGFWQKTDAVIAASSGIYFWFFRLFFLASMLGFHWGTKSLSYFDPFGVKGILKPEKYGEKRAVPFVVSGPYQWVRHPLYLFSLVMIWSCPMLSADRLFFNISWTIWIVVGAMWEEKDLVTYFGDQYITYQDQVPMILPLKLSGKFEDTIK